MQFHSRFSGVKQFAAVLIYVLSLGLAPAAHSQDLVITGVVDGPLTGGIPKALELCAVADIPDLSIYGVGSANNGGGTDGEEFSFPAVAVGAGTLIYVASESAGFSSFFGFAPDYTSGALAINGDDAMELFMSGSVADIFGDINVDGTGQPWEYMDGWAYRADGTGPDGATFTIASWSFSGPNALDGETSNATAATPFPIGTYSGCTPTEPTPDILLSEIVVTPTAGEFIEIHNPTATSIDLSDVYLTDATFAGGATFYYNIVTGANAGGGGFGDFHARFPDGASISAGEFQTIALAGSAGFFAEYGVDPTYELYEDGASADAIPDMREALAGSINGQGGLSNSGEVVILYAWDGETDLVQDIDYALWGDAAEAVDKTGVGIDGPDADGELSFYAPDTAIASQDVILPGAHPFGDSFQRIDFAEGAETQVGGNGITGSDETSEDLSATWAMFAPTPGAEPPPPPPPPVGDWIINEILADPASGLDGDANGDGVRSGSADEFVEIINASGGDVDISGWTIADAFTVRHTFPAGTVVADGCAIVVFGGPTPTGAFGLSEVQTASTGFLGLNNGGDSVTLNNGTDDVATMSYGSEGGDNQSLTRDPDGDATAAFVQHSVATTSGGTLFSPGTKADGTQFSGCPAMWVINEIHADPASGLDGDANGDGTRSSTADEFVEIVNRSGNDVDVSGWTVADGFTVRHTFPAGSIIYDGCSAVIFGGGAPTGAFGNSLVQTASGGGLGLNNGGDTITLGNGVSPVTSVSYGGEGGDNQSLTLDPDVTGTPPYAKHSLATGSGGALYSPGTRIDGSQFDGCPIAAAVAEIQGDGESSPLEGRLVITTGVVTAVGLDGFFMQVPDDGDPNTSDGIFVFTDGPPAVSVGDEVEVTGNVAEFFGMTEITGSPVVNVTGTGIVPAPIVFDGNTPSPDPSAPSCAIEFECYEGMLVEIPAGIVGGSNQRFGTDPIAEVFVTAGPDRPFREPGFEPPGPGHPSIPVWDGNPEVFELDPDKLGLENRIIPARSTFSAVGVIGFEFGDYEFWPVTLDVDPAPLPVAARAKGSDEGTVGSLNLFRLYDDIDDMPDGNRDDTVVSPEVYARRLAKLAAYVVDLMGSPDILAIQEVESLAVMEDLAATIGTLDASVAYSAHLVEGNDVGTIDVGFLVRDNVQVTAVTQLGKYELLTFDGSPLHDRPPLLLDAVVNDAFPISVMVLHMRSLSRIDEPRTQQKRYEQAVSVATKVQAIQDANPDANIVVIGDFNAFEFTDGYVDLAGIIKGDFDPGQSIVCESNACSDLVSPDLVDEVLNVHPAERYSFVFRGNAQVLDHAMTSQALAPLVTGLEFARGNADAAVELGNDAGMLDNLSLRASDHDGLVLYFFRDEDRDGVGDDVDVCRGTVLPEGAGYAGLGVNRFADVDGDGVFDTTPPNGNGPQRSYDIHDTAGCSCEQIIEEQGLGEGHLKFGCSIGAMDNWLTGLGD